MHFTHTSDLLYDKHRYKIVFKNKKSQIVDNYYDLLSVWASTNTEQLDYVEILDKKSSKSKGF